MTFEYIGAGCFPLAFSREQEPKGLGPLKPVLNTTDTLIMILVNGSLSATILSDTGKM